MVWFLSVIFADLTWPLLMSETTCDVSACVYEGPALARLNRTTTTRTAAANSPNMRNERLESIDERPPRLGPFPPDSFTSRRPPAGPPCLQSVPGPVASLCPVADHQCPARCLERGRRDMPAYPSSILPRQRFPASVLFPP